MVRMPGGWRPGPVFLNEKEASGQTQDLLERLQFLVDLGKPQCLLGELQKMAGEKEVGGSLLRLLPAAW